MVSVISPKLFIYFTLLLKFASLIFFFNSYEFSDPFSIYGHDESFMHLQSKDLLQSFKENGISYTIIESSSIIGSYNVTWPLIMAGLLSIYNHVIIVMIFKVLFFSVSSYYFFKLSYILTNSKRVAWVSLILISFYPPLNIYMFSIFRDDIIFSIFTISFYNSIIYKHTGKNLNLIFSIFLTLLMLPLRIHTAFISFLIIIHNSINKFSILKFLGIFVCFYIIVFPLINSFVFIGYIYLTESLPIVSMNLLDISKDLLKFLFGPLPWKIVEGHHLYSYYWYYFALIMIFLSIYLFPFELLKSIKNNLVYLSIFFIYFFAYYISHHFLDALGPRQFALIAPFLFIFIYGDIIKKLRF